MKENFLTRKQVEKLGLHKETVITADMLDGYTGIDDWAFFACRSLTSITIPNSITSIGDYAFYQCTGLTSITIPNSITSIGEWAFYNCINLTSVTIPNSITRIEYDAFYNCINLTSVTIPNSVKSIGYEAFYGCNFKEEKRIDKQGRIVAYKGFNANMKCRGFQYKEGKTYEIKETPILCVRGFHACLNPLDCLNYYFRGEIGKDVVFHEVYLESVSDEKEHDSKVVAKKITIGREISLSEMAEIASGRK